MKVIVNADDFGHDHETVDATVRAVRARVVTSASIQVGRPGSVAALAFAATCADVSFGVHLVFTGREGESPIESGHSSSLVDRHGRFRSPNVVRALAIARRLRVEDIIAEIDRQIGTVVDHGVRVTHVDSHYHLHKLEPFTTALRTALPRFGIRRVRAAQNVRIAMSPLRPTWWTGASDAARLQAAFASTDWFYMLDEGSPAQWWERCRVLWSRPGVLEFGCHPGTTEQWRCLELQAATEFAAWCRSERIDRVDWRAVRI